MPQQRLGLRCAALSDNYDVVIVGGGAVGTALACMLNSSSLRIAVIEAVARDVAQQPDYDSRGLSLSLSSKNILSNIGLWSQISDFASPIKNIHVSDQHRFGFVRLRADDINVPALGYVVTAYQLNRVLMQTISSADNVDLLCPASVSAVEVTKSRVKITVAESGNKREISAKLLVLANGSNSKIRTELGMLTTVKDYQQVAIVSQVVPQKYHHHTAYERFTKDGTVALLPYTQQRCMLVFTVAAVQADDYMQMDQSVFLEILLKRFSRRLGRFSDLSRRQAHAIKIVRCDEQFRRGLLVLGNAAHTMHPNAAQGLNLGLRDAAALAEALAAAHREGADIASDAPAAYVQARVADQNRIIRFTDQLAHYFYNSSVDHMVIRSLMMSVIDLTPPLRRRFTYHAMGFWKRQPELIYA